MKIEAAFGDAQRVFVDTAPLIYYLERNPAYFPRMDRFFRLRRERGIVLITSPVTLAECLVHPIRLGMRDLATAYTQLLTEGVGVEFHEIGQDAGVLAAQLRATLSIPLLDALQASMASLTHCQVFFTNDRKLSRIGNCLAGHWVDVCGGGIQGFSATASTRFSKRFLPCLSDVEI